MKLQASFLPRACASWVRRKISSACSLDSPDIARAASDGIVMGGPLLETNCIYAGGRDPLLILNDQIPSESVDA